MCDQNHPLAKPGFCNGRGFDNDFTFDHTLYIGADPKSFDGGCNFELGLMLVKYKDV